MATQPYRLERWTNSGSTTLAAEATSGSGTISVTSATPFPTTGYFRLLLSGTEEVLVKSISGTTFTLNANLSSTHSNGATVELVASSSGLDQAFKEAFGFPGSDVPFNRILSGATTKVAADFTWLNQGTATCTDADDGGLNMTLPSEANHQIRGKYITAPATPWTLTAFCQLGPGMAIGASGTYMGVFCREASSSKLYFLPLAVGTSAAARTIGLWRMTNETTFSANVDTGYDNIVGGIWMRLTDDGTDIKASYSTDGVNYLELFTDGRASFFTSGPDQVGFGGSSGSGAAGAYLHFKTWSLQ